MLSRGAGASRRQVLEKKIFEAREATKYMYEYILQYTGSDVFG